MFHGDDLVKRTAPLLTLIGLALLLAACQVPPPTFTYQGTTTTAGAAQPLTLTFEQRGERLLGEYQVRAAKGTFRGTLEGDTVTADLAPSPNCTYTFEGTLGDAMLTGAFEPTACPGGEPGTWALDLQ